MATPKVKALSLEDYQRFARYLLGTAKNPFVIANRFHYSWQADDRDALFRYTGVKRCIRCHVWRKFSSDVDMCDKCIKEESDRKHSSC